MWVCSLICKKNSPSSVCVCVWWNWILLGDCHYDVVVRWGGYLHFFGLWPMSIVVLLIYCKLKLFGWFFCVCLLIGKFWRYPRTRTGRLTYFIIICFQLLVFSGLQVYNVITDSRNARIVKATYSKGTNYIMFQLCFGNNFR